MSGSAIMDEWRERYLNKIEKNVNCFSEIIGDTIKVATDYQKNWNGSALKLNECTERFSKCVEENEDTLDQESYNSQRTK